jgi:hypothetical protein
MSAERIEADAVGRVAGQLLCRLGAANADLMRRAVHSPRRFAVSVLAGVNAGAVAGVCGPLIGAALGGLAGIVAALTGTPRG